MKFTKPWTLEIFMECYCVVRNEPMRREITKLQTATTVIGLKLWKKVIGLWFWGLLVYRELYFDWPVHDQHSWNFSGVRSFMSLTAKTKNQNEIQCGVSCICSWDVARLDYQPLLFRKTSLHSSPERAAGRVRFPLLV